jgi:hypothetical protein
VPYPDCGRPVTFVKGKDQSAKCLHCGTVSQVGTEQLGRSRLPAEETIIAQCADKPIRGPK